MNVVHQPNDHFRRAREAVPSTRTSGECLSRQEVADLVNEWVFRHHGKVVEVDANYVGKLERGIIHWPSRWYREALRTVLRVDSDAQLGFRGQRRRPGSVDRQRSRRTAGNASDAARDSQNLVQANECADAAGASSASEDLVDVLARIQSRGRTVDQAAIELLQSGLAEQVSQYERIPHSELLPALLKQRRWTERLFEDCNRSPQRQQLLEVASGTSGLLGYIAVGQGKFSLARAYCAEAFQLADLAGETNLQAWARGLQSFCEYYAGDYQAALDLARDGLAFAGSGPQSVRLTINGIARALGQLGDTDGVQLEVDRAYQLLDANDVPPGLPSSIGFGCYSVAQTASNAVTAYVSLGLASEAHDHAALALPAISQSDSPWSRSLITIDLAKAMISTGADLEKAAQMVVEALTISADRPVISVATRAREFVHQATVRWGRTKELEAIHGAVNDR